MGYDKEYNLVLYNDPLHSFEYVVKTLVKCMSITPQEAVHYAIMIHHNQRTVVFSGMLEHAEHYAEIIENSDPEERDGKLLLPLTVKVERNMKRWINM